MRIGFGLVAASLALALVVTPSSSAPPGESAKAPEGATAESPPASPETAIMPPANPPVAVSTPGGATGGTGFRRPTNVVDATPLTLAECLHHDGEVVADYAGVCASGLFCRTTDNTGKKHRVCLSKAQ